jgi:hypothetical protein
MLIFFVLFLILSIWKIYAFLPNKQLEDDDRTKEAHEELKSLMFKVIKDNKGNLNNKELFLAMLEDENFDSQLFWRFNHNRLNQLINQYYIENPHAKSIMDIYKDIS